MLKYNTTANDGMQDNFLLFLQKNAVFFDYFSAFSVPAPLFTLLYAAAPLIEYYRSEGKLMNIAGSGSLEEISAEIFETLEAIR